VQETRETRRLFDSKGPPKDSPRPPRQKEDWGWFWGQIRAMGLTKEEVCRALGVTDMKDYKGTLRKALDILARTSRQIDLPQAESDFYERCFDEFGLQPDQAIEKTTYGNADNIEDWAEAYQQVKAALRS